MPARCFACIFLTFLALSTFKAEAVEILRFEGEADLKAGSLQLTIRAPGSKVIDAAIFRRSARHFELQVNLDHVPTPYFEFSTVLTADLDVPDHAAGQPVTIKGKIKSQFTLVNNLPVQDFSGDFIFAREALEINSLSMGDIFCKGRLETRPPGRVNLSLLLSDLELSQFLGFVMAQSGITAQGRVNGKIDITGSWAAPRLTGDLTSDGGKVGKYIYNKAVIHAQGVYPVVELSRSSLIKGDGMLFGVKGPLDLSDRKNFVKQVKALHILPYVEEGVDKAEWTLKRFEDEGRSGATEFKYLLRKSEPGENDDETHAILGVEHKVQW